MTPAQAAQTVRGQRPQALPIRLRRGGPRAPSPPQNSAAAHPWRAAALFLFQAFCYQVNSRYRSLYCLAEFSQDRFLSISRRTISSQRPRSLK